MVFVISPWRAMRKYGARGLRFALQEVGAIAQQINLVCTGLGLASVESSSFYEDELKAMKVSGLLTRLTLAWSRDGSEKIYVQDRIDQNAAEVVAWLEAQGLAKPAA